MMKIKNIIHRISSYRKYIISIGLVLCLGIGAYMTISYLSSGSSLQNQFKIASVDPEVIETFENNVKSNVYVQNKGDIPVYIRAKIMIYYQDTNGNILGDIPDKKDYEITYPADLKNNWIKATDGFYYYKKVIEANDDNQQTHNDQTTTLIETCIENQPHPDRNLVVDIVAEAIQANPKEAVEDAWKAIDVADDGTLKETEVTEP